MAHSSSVNVLYFISEGSNVFPFIVCIVYLRLQWTSLHIVARILRLISCVPITIINCVHVRAAPLITLMIWVICKSVPTHIWRWSTIVKIIILWWPQ